MVKCSNSFETFQPFSHIFQRSSYTTNSTKIVLIFPKTRVYDDSNIMHNIFLLLIQAAQFKLIIFKYLKHKCTRTGFLKI